MNKPPKNSTLAAALSYTSGSGEAPRLAAFGERQLADEIRKIALRYGVPIKSDASLAVRLAELGQDEAIPSELFDDVAHLLVELGISD